MAKCSRTAVFLFIFTSLSVLGLVTTYLTSNWKEEPFLSACPRSPTGKLPFSTKPRDVGLIFSSFKKPKTTMVMLKSFQKYGEGFELKVMTDLRREISKAKELERLVIEHGAELVYIDSTKYTQPYYPAEIPFMNKRILLQRDWLRENSLNLKDDDRVFISDEDIFFTNSPFGIFEQYPERSLFIFSEAYNFTNNKGWNFKYIEITTDVKALREFVKEKQVFCMGFVMGKALQLQHLMERMITAFIIQGFPPMRFRRASDQGVLNVLLHTGILDDLEMEAVGDKDPWVAHLTSQLQRKDLVEFALGHAVVHQYKYALDIVEHIKSIYGIDVNMKD